MLFAIRYRLFIARILLSAFCRFLAILLFHQTLFPAHQMLFAICCWLFAVHILLSAFCRLFANLLSAVRYMQC